ncbi:MAG: hypothetical protein ACXV3V_08485, partial [Actinomycetes bacterium]
MIAAVTAQVPPSTPVVTDDQYLVADAGRETPAELVDTSYVRIESGWLPLDELTRVTTAEHAAVLFTGGRLDKVPGFRSWVDQHAIKVASFPDGGALYLPR